MRRLIDPQAAELAHTEGVGCAANQAAFSAPAEAPMIRSGCRPCWIRLAKAPACRAP